MITIGAKILLLLPPISWRLTAIRNGEKKGFLCACATLRRRLGTYDDQSKARAEAEEGTLDGVDLVKD